MGHTPRPADAMVFLSVADRRVDGRHPHRLALLADIGIRDAGVPPDLWRTLHRWRPLDDHWAPRVPVRPSEEMAEGPVVRAHEPRVRGDDPRDIPDVGRPWPRGAVRVRVPPCVPDLGGPPRRLRNRPKVVARAWQPLRTGCRRHGPFSTADARRRVCRRPRGVLRRGFPCGGLHDPATSRVPLLLGRAGDPRVWGQHLRAPRDLFPRGLPRRISFLGPIPRRPTVNRLTATAPRHRTSNAVGSPGSLMY